MEPLKRVYISRGALAHNFKLCRRQAGDAGVIALVKADAYGHGMLECARLFAGLGASGLAVAEAVEEAVVDSMVANETMTGRDGNRSIALPLDQVMELMKRYNRL